jgi:hypothetical protein
MKGVRWDQERARVRMRGGGARAQQETRPSRSQKYWGIVINKRRLNKVTLNKVRTRQHVKHLRRFCSTVAV